jgi:hypothetical protein
MVQFILVALIALAPINLEVGKTLNIGDAKSLVAFFPSNIDLTIKNEEGIYTKIQAEQILKKFFTAHPVVKYTVVHVGSAKDGSSFEIGKLQTQSGTYRTYFLLKGKGDNQKIHQFRIEDDK